MVTNFTFVYMASNSCKFCFRIQLNENVVKYIVIMVEI